MYLVQVVRGFCRWSGTDIPGKRSFDSSDVSHAPGELLFYLLTIWSGTDIPGKTSFDSLDVSHAPGEMLFYLLTIW